MDKTVLLISGKKQAGKNTIADYIQKRFCEVNPYNLVPPIVSFADELKKTCHKLFGVPLEWMYGTDEDKNRKTHVKWGDLPIFLYHAIPTDTLTVRELLQIFGTDICRKMDEDCWARAFYNHVEALPNRLVINADARFPNELEFSTTRKRISIRLTRKISNDNHKSETALDDYSKFDFVVDNHNLNKEQTLQVVEDKIIPCLKIN